MLRILLVEDEVGISMIASIALEDEGYHVTIASDGYDGLDIALKDRPELIITDYMMPRMTGIEMIQRLRAKGFDAPIILTTSIPERVLPSRIGYNAYLPKPYSQQDLLQILARFRP